MPTYRLDSQPWIPVVDHSGAPRHVGLEEAFSASADIAFIAGTPLEAVSLTRLLLAIAQLAAAPTTLEEWRNLFENRKDTMQRCAEYVARHRDVWDLFDPENPFGQVATQDRTLNPAYVLVYEAARKNNPVLADHNVEADPKPIPPPTLARAILAANAFAGSSGGGYRSGPLAMRTVGMLAAGDLATTILLNLLVRPEKPAPLDWAQFGQLQPKVTDIDLPRRYVWSSRCIRLLPDANGEVRRAMLAPGNEMPEDERAEDPMVAYHLDSQGKTFVPLRLDPSRALWRSAHVLLNWHSDVRRLGALEQLDKLKRREYVPAGLNVSMRICAVGGDAQGPSTDLWRDEILPFDLSIIGDDERFAALGRAVHAAEDAASTTRKRIYAFAGRYLQNRGESKPDKDDVQRLADELGKGQVDFWTHIAVEGERIACDDFDGERWLHLLREGSDLALSGAVGRLVPDARRLRAEFARPQTTRGGAV